MITIIDVIEVAIDRSFMENSYDRCIFMIKHSTVSSIS